MKGRIVDISFDTMNTVYIKQGVEGRNQYRYDGRYSGGNGTYVVGGEYDSFIWLKVFVYELDKCILVDIKDTVLEVNSRRRVSGQMINTLVANNVGKKVKLDVIGGKVLFPYSQLNLIV
jgi:hypothetical protein